MSPTLRPLFTLILFLLPLCAPSADAYRVSHLSENETLRIYTDLMRDACRHASQFWRDHEWPGEPSVGVWGSGRSDQINEGIRAISEMVLTASALLKYSDALGDNERSELKRKALAAIRYSVATHVSGTKKCTDGKPWGGSWQSALWTGTLGMGAWLIWDQLDERLRGDVERILASESDRFLNTIPPTGTRGDTKAEENGWNMICLSVSANVFPRHPHAGAWNEKALEYMMNTLSAPQDQQDQSIVDGRPVSSWFAGQNVNSDFTLENHGIFHPSYVACSSYFLTQAAMHYTLAGLPVPHAASHHLMDTWKMFQRIILPSAEAAFPQGMDWELHGLTFINLFASLATWQKDPLASRMESISLQYMRQWQLMCNGDLAVPGSRLGFTRHASCAEQATYGFLAHKIFGLPVKPPTTQQAAGLVRGVRFSDPEQFLLHRTGSKFASFSWMNRIMGLVIPIGEGHESGPFFTVPIPNSLVGSFDLIGVTNSPPKVIEHHWQETPHGFATTGVLRLNGDRLEQTIKLTSIGEKTILYQDRVIALSRISLARERGIPFGIENDKVSGGKRTVSYQNGQYVLDCQKTQSALSIPGSWASVDGRLGIVMIEGSGLTYAQASGYNHIGVYADILYGSSADHRRDFKPGDVVARRTAIIFVEVTPRQTATLAKSVNIETHESTRLLRFKLPEGGEQRVPL